MVQTFKANRIIPHLLVYLLIPALVLAQRSKEPPVGHLKWFRYLGTYYNMYIGNRMPFTDVSVPAGYKFLSGRFLLDFGTDTTVVDLEGFPGRVVYLPGDHQMGVRIESGGLSTDLYTQYCNFQPCGGFQAGGIREGGIIGTDILSQLIVTLDYKYSRVYLQSDSSRLHMTDTLTKYGFIPVSTKGYYGNHPKTVPNHNNDPMIPVMISDGKDSAQAVAFMDPGFDDRIQLYRDFDNYYTHTININEKYLQHLQQKGIAVTVDKQKFGTIGNISGKPDTLFKCNFGKRYVFSAIGMHGETVIPYSTDDCNVFLKVNAPGGDGAGGITTYPFPAAQFGGSILLDCDEITFDPFSSVVWFRQNER